MESFDRLKAQKDRIIAREKLKSALQISSDFDHRSWGDIERAFDDFSSAAEPPKAISLDREVVARTLYEIQPAEDRAGGDGKPISWFELASFCKGLHYEQADAILALLPAEPPKAEVPIRAISLIDYVGDLDRHGTIDKNVALELKLRIAKSVPELSKSEPPKASNKCANCGFERKERSYNGACYGVCREFVCEPPKAVAREAQPRFFLDHGMIHDRLTGKHVTTEPDSAFCDGIVICCELLNSLAERREQKPFKLLFNNDWLRDKIKTDPDVETEAGKSHPEAPKAALSQAEPDKTESYGDRYRRAVDEVNRMNDKGEIQPAAQPDKGEPV